MARYLLLVGICFVAVGSVIADEPATGLAGNPAPAAALSGRKGLEALLQTPANLDFGQRETVTVKELLAKLHEQHRLSIRFDVPTLAGMYGSNPGGSPQTKNGYASNQVAANCPPYPPPSTITTSAPIAGAASNAPRKTAEPAARVAIPSLPPAPLAAIARASATDELKVDPTAKPAAGPSTGFAPAPQPIARPESEASNREAVEPPQNFLEPALNSEIDIRTIDLKTVSIATALRHALDALPSGDLGDDMSGLPIAFTNATLFDYLVEDDGLQITTRMKALTNKETRVYSIKHLKDETPEQLATVIRQSVRPWSWRSRIDELGDQLKAGTPRIPAKVLGSVVKSGLELAANETGISLTSESSAQKPDAKKDAATDDAEQMAMLGNAVVNGLVTFTHASLTALEIMHYADPPTGSIQTLPGKLVITQSQAAHREIAELLTQLAEE